MAGEAEISFEEAMGGATAAPSTNAPSIPSKGEISFADAAAPEVVEQRPSFMETYTAQRQRREEFSQLQERGREALFDKTTGIDLTPVEGEGFAKHAGKTALRGLRALIGSPTKTLVGSAKALTSGVVGMAESSIAGYRGLGRAAGETLMRETVGRIPIGPTTGPMAASISRAQQNRPLDSAVEEMETSMQETAAMREIASQITKINIAPENEKDKAMEGLLMLLPEGLHAAGETVYEKTGSALAGAGTEGFLTLLTMSPATAGKVISALKPKSKAAVTFEAIATTEPEAAQAIVDHIEPAAPQAASKLKVRLKKVAQQPAEIVGESVAKTEIASKELTPEEVGMGASEATAELPQQGKPKVDAEKPQLTVEEFTGQFEVKSSVGELLAQESGKYLQVKRADVNETARGKGKAQEMMIVLAEEAAARNLTLASDFSVSKDAQRVYEGLKKKGFEVKENPNTINPETGSKVTVDPRVPVYEVSKATPKVIDLSGMGTAIGDNLRKAMWEAFQKDSTKVAGIDEPLVKAALVRKNTIKTREQFDAFAREYTKAREGYVASKKAATESAVVPPSEAAKVDQVFVSGPTLDSLPGGQFVKGKLAAWWDEIIRTVNPEALGPKAKQAAAVLASKIAETSNRDAANHGLAGERIAFWDKITPEKIREFIKAFETGKPQADVVLQKLDKFMRERNKEIFDQDQRNGIKYDPVDNYLAHIFEDGKKLIAYFEAKYGKKWGDPGFMKDRHFNLYEEAIAAGYRPKFTNPEEIMLARQHASDMAQMQVELLKDLEGYGLAKEKTKANPDPPKDGQYNYRRSPNGKGYWVEATADAILYNAFDTQSLWNMPGIRGDLFKGAMFLKNSTVPVVLSLSLFHPLHLLLGMDSAAAMTRLTKEMITGGVGPVKWFGKWLEQMTLGSKGIPLYGIIDNPRVGFRLLKAYQGKIDPAKLTAADRTALQYMNEGGFIPEMSSQYRSNAMDNFRKAVRQVAAEYNSGKGGLGRAMKPAAKAGFYTTFAIIDAMQYPMFRLWIPALKIASYLKDVQTALKVDPTLVADKGRRLLAFRKLSKSVDNRYGEMAYNTLFWNRTIKDIAVANTLSLGWNLGFLREYGGGAMDIGQSATKKGSLIQKARAGDLDRPLFVMFYTTQVMLYSGLLTWAMTGKTPEDLIDYLYPKSGETDAQGKPERLNTPFYPREFAAISKHIEHEGVASGLWHVIANKSSGVIGLVKQWATGVDWRGQEIRDPNSAWHQQVRDTVGATLGDLEPISIEQLRQSDKSVKETVTAFSGFGKAPKYVTQSATEAGISTLYKKYYAPKQTPYETALLSNDRRKLAKLYEEGKADEYGELLDKMMTKYDLTAAEQGQLARNIMKRGQDYNPYVTMFQRLTWQQQKRLLDSMSEEERTEYLPHANKQHLRYTYEEPTEESR